MTIEIPDELRAWIERDDPEEPPPAVASGYDMVFQRLLIANGVRQRSHFGLMDRALHRMND